MTPRREVLTSALDLRRQRILSLAARISLSTSREEDPPAQCSSSNLCVLFQCLIQYLPGSCSVSPLREISNIVTRCPPLTPHLSLNHITFHQIWEIISFWINSSSASRHLYVNDWFEIMNKLLVSMRYRDKLKCSNFLDGRLRASLSWKT